MHVQVKNIVAILFISLGLLGCGASSRKDKQADLNDKKAALLKLQDEQKKQSDKIAALQKEIDALDTASAKVQKAKLVTVATIQPDSFAHYIDLQGRIEAVNSAFVTPQNGGGQVKAIYVKQGDAVHKGQLLMKLDDAAVRTQLGPLQTQLSYAKDVLRRQQNLWEQGIGTEIQVVSNKTNVANLQKQIEIVNQQLAQTNVYAQISGVADKVNIKVGEVFSPATASMAGISIVNTSALKVTTQVPENYQSGVHVGSPLKIVFPESMQLSFDTRVSVTGKIIDPSTRSFYVEAPVKTSGSLRPNQLALVKILNYSANNAITIPVNTLQNDETGKYVMVAEQQKNKMVARKKMVNVGELYGDKMEVKTGLQTGDVIITDGYQSLYDGQLITTN